MIPRCQACRPAHVKELSSRDNFKLVGLACLCDDIFKSKISLFPIQNEDCNIDYK